MSKKIYTQSDLSHAIDLALHYGDAQLAELYGIKKCLETTIKSLTDTYNEVQNKIYLRELYGEKFKQLEDGSYYIDLEDEG